ncbi:MAG TPA: MATE family efflux transporter [Phycisphaerae bacterium]|nr:MATE family efflux transporter [Phycisphaerae bacterium]
MRADRENKILDGPIRSAVLWLALPVLGEQALNAAVTWNDTLVAGRISAQATGAVGLASYISWLMSMIAWMVDTGATVLVARAVGGGNYREAQRATNQAFLLALMLGTIGTAAVFGCAPGIARIMNLGPEGSQIASSFMRIDTVGYLGNAVALAMASCLRGAGDTRTPMVVLGGVNVVNMIFTWLLTFGGGPVPAFGTNGIAWGTAIARWSGGIWMVWLLQRRRPRTGEGRAPLSFLRLHPLLMSPDWGILRRILSVGLPAAMDGALAFSGHFIFTTIVTRVPSMFTPTVLYAAHVVGIRIESLSYLPANAWSVAASTMVGQNLGGGQPERARRSANEAVRQAMMLLAFTGLLYFFAARPLFRILSNDPDVWACGTPALKGLACVQVPLAILIVYLGALRGAGDTRVPMVITALGVGLVRIPVAFLGGVILRGGLLGAWMGMFTDIVVRSGLLAWRFHTNRWARIRV